MWNVIDLKWKKKTLIKPLFCKATTSSFKSDTSKIELIHKGDDYLDDDDDDSDNAVPLIQTVKIDSLENHFTKFLLSFFSSEVWTLSDSKKK